MTGTPDSPEIVNPGETPEAGRNRTRRPVRDVIETIVIAIVILVVVQAFVLRYEVDGSSMEPTFASGERILVNRNAYQEFNLGDLVDWIPGVSNQHWVTIVDAGEPQRGDVIVFTPPDPGNQTPYIKRVIGIPGDHVQITEQRDVLVNGTVLDEAYIGEFTTRCTYEPVNCDVVVPEGHVFTLGDNRNGSEDSRYYGLVPLDRIIGKAWFVYWPPNVVGPVDSPDHPELNP